MPKQFPLDAIGNSIRKGDLVRVALQEAALVFSVADVELAQDLVDGVGGRIPTTGTITLVASIPMQYAPDRGPLANFLVLKKPAELEPAPSGLSVVPPRTEVTQ